MPNRDKHGRHLSNQRRPNPSSHWHPVINLHPACRDNNISPLQQHVDNPLQHGPNHTSSGDVVVDDRNADLPTHNANRLLQRHRHHGSSRAGQLNSPHEQLHNHDQRGGHVVQLRRRRNRHEHGRRKRRGEHGRSGSEHGRRRRPGARGSRVVGCLLPLSPFAEGSISFLFSKIMLDSCHGSGGKRSEIHFWGYWRTGQPSQGSAPAGSTWDMKSMGND